MASVSSNAEQKIQNLYLNEEGADVRFVFGSKRIPAHKLLLTTINPWMEKMFFGAIPEGDEVNMDNSNVTAEEFQEFLRSFYLLKLNLTMQNIEGILDLAKQSMADDIFTECEDFLIKSMTTDNMCRGYQLALLYDAKRLKATCEDEICANAEQVLRSSSFMHFREDFLSNILLRDELACEEKYVFDACISWAKAACERNDQDPTKADELRSHLKDSLYQIRFVSMSKEEAADCISAVPGLFSAGELEEIICMVGHSMDYKPKKFNWTPRYFNLQWDKGRQLKCDRFDAKKTKLFYEPRAMTMESTIFTCSRRVLLKGFNCELANPQLIISQPATIQITEKRCDDPQQTSIERYNEQTILNFEHERKEFRSLEAIVKLDKVILIRPKYVYEICITFSANVTKLAYADMEYKSFVLLDFDTVIRFDQRKDIISSLHLCRFDNKRFLKKITSNPKAWSSHLCHRFIDAFKEPIEKDPPEQIECKLQ